MSARTCQHCHQPLVCTSRSDARYCSVRCRVAAHRARHSGKAIPADLRDRPRWVRHDAKRPITVDGRSASSTNASTWATYEQATSSAVGDGIGFVLNGDGIVCLDLDHCLTDAGLEPWAADVLDALPSTYIEVSPSGHGLHVWGRGGLHAGRQVAVGEGRFEMYGQGRYLTVTGHAFRSAPSTLADLTAFISQVC